MGNSIPNGIWGGLSLVHCGFMVVGLFSKVFIQNERLVFFRIGGILFFLGLSLFSS